MNKINFKQSTFTEDQWLNQSMNFLPMDVYSEEPLAANAQLPIKVEQTAQLIREFDSVFEVVELTHLTPPQTPPQSPRFNSFSTQLKQVSKTFFKLSILFVCNSCP